MYLGHYWELVLVLLIVLIAFLLWAVATMVRNFWEHLRD
jgi:hypothetical protein